MTPTGSCEGPEGEPLCGSVGHPATWGNRVGPIPAAVSLAFEGYQGDICWVFDTTRELVDGYGAFYRDGFGGFKILDVEDPLLDDFRDLKVTACATARPSAVIAEGPEGIRLLLHSDFVVDRLLLKPSLFETMRASIEARAVRRGEAAVQVLMCEIATMEHITGIPARHASAVFAAARRPSSGFGVVRALEVDSCAALLATNAVVPGFGDCTVPLRVLAVSSLDEEAVGSLFRVGAAFGVHAILLSEDCGDPFSRRAARVSMGHVFRVPVVRGDLVAMIGALRSTGALAIAAAAGDAVASASDASDATRWFDELEGVPPRWVCAVGPEECGAPRDVCAACDSRVSVRTVLGGCPLGTGVYAAVLLNGLVERENFGLTDS